MKIRYAITRINEDGYRQLAFANQGRNHFEDRDSAEFHLKMTLKHNKEKFLKSLYGDISELRVDEVECYDHGDAIRVIFEEDKEFKMHAF
jgi:hypothetical protein